MKAKNKPGRKKKLRYNWAWYENSRKDEARRFARKLKELVFALPPLWTPRKKKGGPGKPYQDPRGLAFLAVMQEYTSETDRNYEGWVKANPWLVELAGLDYPPSRRSVQRYRSRMTKEWLDELNTSILKVLGSSGRYAADATGFKNSSRDEAWSKRADKEAKDKKDYTKFHGLIDIETKGFTSFKSTPGREHESPHLKDLLEPVGEMKEFLGDAGYLSRENCTRVAKKGASRTSS